MPAVNLHPPPWDRSCLLFPQCVPPQHSHNKGRWSRTSGQQELGVMRLYKRLTGINTMAEFTCLHSHGPIHFLLQAGMIRMEQEEFFIEPVERGDEAMEKGEKEGGGGRTHIIYRSSAVKKAPISSPAADYHSRGQSAAPTVPSFCAPFTGCFSWTVCQVASRLEVTVKRWRLLKSNLLHTALL